MKRKTPKRAHSVLGLTLSDGRLQAFHVTRTKNGIEVVKAANADLTLDLLHPEAELIGREIKNHLDAGGIRERHCVVGIPARWVMSQHTQVPELAPADAASFLQMEAEKGFPVDPANLQIAQSVQQSTAGEFVTQLAVRQEQIVQLGEVLKAAGLKPVSYSLGLAALPGAIPPPGSGGRITVAVDPAGVALLVSAGGGIAALRTFEASIESEAGENIVNGAAVARELRITFEQVPAALRSEVKELFLTGDATMVRQLAESLGDWARISGLNIKRGDLPEKNLAAETAEKLAENWLQGSGPYLEFLPPKPSRWAMMMARYNSKRLATVGFAAAAAVLVVIGAFGWHEYRRWSLQKQWSTMEAQVTKLNGVQANINEFRLFYDTSFHSLSIMKRVTECFPETGVITAKSFEIRRSATRPTVSALSISGSARDTATVLRVQDSLRKLKEAEAVKIDKISGKTPTIQFTITLRWNT
ncbi:MAG: hypothetical protein ABIO94_08605 [Opitutaceae bacterium]